jgi:hypothetical protein
MIRPRPPKVDSMGRALPQGVRHGTYAGRQQHRGQSKPLPLDLQCHPQRAERVFPNGRWMADNLEQTWKGRKLYWAKRLGRLHPAMSLRYTPNWIKPGDYALCVDGTVHKRVDINDGMGYAAARNEREGGNRWTVTV